MRQINEAGSITAIFFYMKLNYRNVGKKDRPNSLPYGGVKIPFLIL